MTDQTNQTSKIRLDEKVRAEDLLYANMFHTDDRKYINIEIRPYPHLAADDRYRQLAIQVKTDSQSYTFSEILTVSDVDSVFDRIMEYGTFRLKELMKRDGTESPKGRRPRKNSR